MKADPRTEHHIWCNFFLRSREGCKMCDGREGADGQRAPGLWESYPYDDEEAAIGGDLMAEHFPENKLRG